MSGLLTHPHVGSINAPMALRRHRTFLLPMHPHPNNQNIAVSSMSIHQQNPKVIRRCCASLRKREEAALAHVTIDQLHGHFQSVTPKEMYLM